MLSTSKTCTVKFRELTDYEINDYVTRYPATTFSAAFNGDGLTRFAESIEGSYNFSNGLPMNELILFLREHNIKV